jgi:5-methyltetrahydropteroyltriglutamate--homocysteine methyltransferase
MKANRGGGRRSRYRERVIAGVDCGFGTFVGWEWVTEDIVWAKLKTLRDGADIASRRLWGKKAA